MTLVSLRQVTGSLVAASCTHGQVMLPICIPGHILLPMACRPVFSPIENKACFPSLRPIYGSTRGQVMGKVTATRTRKASDTADAFMAISFQAEPQELNWGWRKDQ
jgi:hypothetical protein